MIGLVVIGEQAAIAALDAFRTRIVCQCSGIASSNRGIDILVVHQLQCRSRDLGKCIGFADQATEHACATLGRFKCQNRFAIFARGNGLGQDLAFLKLKDQSQSRGPGRAVAL